MRRAFWQRLALLSSVCIFVYLVVTQFTSQPGLVISPNPETISGKNVLRQIFNVVHSSFDPQKTLTTNQPQDRSNTSEFDHSESPAEKEALQTPIGQLSTTRITELTTPSHRPSNYINAHIHCVDKDMGPRVDQRSGNYWVLYNYIRGERSFRCNETLTYTTHGEYTFLHNLEPLLTRWQGPVSVSIFAPGDDYLAAVQAILYYRDCSATTLVKDYATFHIFFPFAHMPNTSLFTQDELAKVRANCAVKPAVIEEQVNTYRNWSALDYPVNVGRNIARETANSHFIFPSDIELYPNPGLIPSFFDMIRRNEKYLKRTKPRVFVSSIFEIKKDVELPNTKSELVEMLRKNSVILFHKKVCSQCHAIPKSKEWTRAPVRNYLNVFHVAKRVPPYSHWEPIYIGTNNDPFYDERLTWEGRSDKMTQGYQLCVLDYDFMILDNSFLVHRPGIKTKVDNLNQTQRDKVAAQNTLISKTIMPELQKLYGTRTGCEK